MRVLGHELFRKPADEAAGLAAEPAAAIPAPRVGARPRIGVALGAGAARGWCHIGVLRELEAMGVRPDVIVGTSIGAVVGGCHAAGRLDSLEEFARGLTRTRVFTLLDWSFSGRGLISGARLKSRLESGLENARIEDLPIRFAAIATEAGSGHEVWLTRGPMTDALRASYALPGIFEPVQIEKRWLFDGAVVNPVPVNVCRALGADLVIAVNVLEPARPISAMRADQFEPVPAEAEVELEPPPGGLLSLMRGRNWLSYFRRGADGAPSMASILMDTFNVTQDRIARSRLAGDPPDVFIRGWFNGVGLFDFHRAADLIEAGRQAVRRARHDLVHMGIIRESE